MPEVIFSLKLHHRVIFLHGSNRSPFLRASFRNNACRAKKPKIYSAKMDESTYSKDKKKSRRSDSFYPLKRGLLTLFIGFVSLHFFFQSCKSTDITQGRFFHLSIYRLHCLLIAPFVVRLLRSATAFRSA